MINFSSNVLENNQRVIKDVAAWDAVWQEAVAYYWQHNEALRGRESDLMFVVLNNLGIKNISNEDNGYVGIRTTTDVENTDLILKVRINPSVGNPTFNEKFAFANVNGWSNLTGRLTIKLPSFDTAHCSPTEQSKILAAYTTLGLYFPFALDSRKAYDQHDRVPVNVTQPLNVVSQPLATPTLNVAENAVGGSYGSNLAQMNDRGGAQGLDSDYEWLQFVPRLVAYNWHHNNMIKHGSRLTDYPEMLYNLGYRPPIDLTICVQYAQVVADNQNIVNAHVSELDLAFPQPLAQTKLQPIALADLMAARANEPFTCC